MEEQVKTGSRFMKARVLSVHVGKVKKFPRAGEMASAIEKSLHAGRVRLTTVGLEGDTHADTVDHGGIHQAIHFYPSEHYAKWREEFPELQESLLVGMLGENISTEGLTEEDVCVGDLLQINEAIVEVSQSRVPCAKLTYQTGEPGILNNFLSTGRTGWFARVKKEGALGAGEPIILLDRPNPRWTIRRIARFRAGELIDADGLAEMASLIELSPSWRSWAAKAFTSSMLGK